MGSKVVRLFPPDGETEQHKNLYLRQDLRSLNDQDESVFVYANFIVSLDGRIAVPDPDGKGVTLATTITNPRDWRLFQELAVQADVLITSGRYLREYDHGPKQELLQVYDDPEFEDLGNWRVEQGLSKYPAIAVVSRSLDFNVPSPLQDPGRQLFVFTTEQADQELKAKLSDQGSEVIVAGKDGVTGRALVAGLRSNGFRLVYSTAGPHILHMLLNGNVLDRLYLTIAMRTLGGKPFSSIVEGSLLDPPTNFKMHSLYLDPDGPEGSSQVYVALDRIPFGQSSS